jgi:hypothetical protein
MAPQESPQAGAPPAARGAAWWSPPLLGAWGPSQTSSQGNAPGANFSSTSLFKVPPSSLYGTQASQLSDHPCTHPPRSAQGRLGHPAGTQATWRATPPRTPEEALKSAAHHSPCGHRAQSSQNLRPRMVAARVRPGPAQEDSAGSWGPGVSGGDFFTRAPPRDQSGPIARPRGGPLSPGAGRPSHCPLAPIAPEHPVGPCPLPRSFPVSLRVLFFFWLPP